MNEFSPELFQEGNKHVQKSLLKKYLPENLIAFEKKGFVAPFQNSSYYNFENNYLPNHLNEMLTYLKKNIHDKISKNFI